MCMIGCVNALQWLLGVIISTLSDYCWTAFVALRDRLAHTVCMCWCVRRHVSSLLSLRLTVFVKRTFCAWLWVTSVMTMKCYLSIFILWMVQRSCLLGQRRTIHESCSRVQNVYIASELTQNPAICFLFTGRTDLKKRIVVLCISSTVHTCKWHVSDAASFSDC